MHVHMYYLFAAVAGSPLHRLFSSSSEPGLFLEQHRLQGPPASVVSARGFRTCGSQAMGTGSIVVLLQGTWDLPGSGMEPMSPALEGGFFTTEPPGKPFQMSLAM